MNYELKSSTVKYTHQGELQEAEFIQLQAPSFNQLNLHMPIKQAFVKAITEIDSGEANESEEAQSDEGIKPEGAMQLLYTWSGDLAKLLDDAAKLFCTKVAMIDGETKMTKPLLEQLSGEDFEGLMGTYVANFIIPSLKAGT